MDIFSLSLLNKHADVLVLIQDAVLVDEFAVESLLNDRDDRGRYVYICINIHGFYCIFSNAFHTLYIFMNLCNLYIYSYKQ